MPADTAAPPVQRLAAAEVRLATIAPGFLERVRQAANRLAVRDPDGTDASEALVAVDDLALIDLDVPTISNIPMAPLVKKVVKRLIGWYLGYFGRQLSAFGQAVTHLGAILVDRTERLEGVTTDLQTDLARLTERVAQLERGRSRQS